MSVSPFITQAISIAGMAFALAGFQFKKHKTVVVFQLISSSLFAIHYFLLGAMSGCLLNLLASVRSLFYTQRDRYTWVTHPFWVYLFSALSLAMYAASFLVFQTEPSVRNLVLELFPVIAFFLTTAAFRTPDSSRIRGAFGLIAPLWLTYNIFHGSIGGIISQLFKLTSVIIGYFRLDRNKTGE